MTAHCMEITSSHLTVVAVPGMGGQATALWCLFTGKGGRFWRI